MKKPLILTLLFFLPFAVFGQTTQTISYDNSGFHIGASLLGTAWSLDDVDADTDTGGGIGLNLGYNFNANFGLFTSIDFSRIESDSGENYDMAHFDLGIRGYFRSIENRVRPHVSAALVGMAASDDVLELSGGGLGLGAGVLIFISERFALDFAYTHSFINISEATIESQTFDID